MGEKLKTAAGVNGDVLRYINDALEQLRALGFTEKQVNAKVMEKRPDLFEVTVNGPEDGMIAAMSPLWTCAYLDGLRDMKRWFWPKAEESLVTPFETDEELKALMDREYLRKMAIAGGYDEEVDLMDEDDKLAMIRRHNELMGEVPELVALEGKLASIKPDTQPMVDLLQRYRKKYADDHKRLSLILSSESAEEAQRALRKCNALADVIADLEESDQP
jgi:hypothetical protein